MAAKTIQAGKIWLLLASLHKKDKTVVVTLVKYLTMFKKSLFLYSGFKPQNLYRFRVQCQILKKYKKIVKANFAIDAGALHRSSCFSY